MCKANQKAEWKIASISFDFLMHCFEINCLRNVNYEKSVRTLSLSLTLTYFTHGLILDTHSPAPSQTKEHFSLFSNYKFWHLRNVRVYVCDSPPIEMPKQCEEWQLAFIKLHVLEAHASSLQFDDDEIIPAHWHRRKCQACNTTRWNVKIDFKIVKITGIEAKIPKWNE